MCVLSVIVNASTRVCTTYTIYLYSLIHAPTQARILQHEYNYL